MILAFLLKISCVDFCLSLQFNSMCLFLCQNHVDVFIVVLPVMSRIEPRCPSAEECIKKMWYIYMMEYYSAVKNKDTGNLKANGQN